jgi:hypothetical protein
MGFKKLLLFAGIVLPSMCCKAQQAGDSLITSLQNLPQRYLSNIENKVDKYASRITSKTERTLAKLVRFEEKIYRLLKAASPETAARLFSPGALTFATALQKFKQGEALFSEKRVVYNQYRDQLTTSINYLNEQKDKLNTQLIQPLKKVTAQVKEYEAVQDHADEMERFIKERKRQLIDQSLAYLGQSKWLTKISKESFYFLETLKNYKSILADTKKVEQTAVAILNKIPAFKSFVQNNSILSSLFAMPGANSTATITSLAGLQTRASVNVQIQSAIAAGGPNAAAQISKNLQAAQAELGKLKDKILKAGGSSSDAEIPEFRVNEEHSKTFLQRISFGTDVNFTKSTSYIPSAANLALTISYKLSKNKELGLGLSYLAGLGSIKRIQLSHQGIGFRSFANLKFKKNLWITGGWESNYNAGFKNIDQLKTVNSWQQSALAGLSKRLNIKTKWFKGSKISILYDALAHQHLPVTNSWIFRTGYNF